MLVYGDIERFCAPRAAIAELGEALRAQAAAPAGLARHSDLVGILVDAAELAQGLADASFAARGADARSTQDDAAAALLLALARAVLASWRSGYAAAPDTADVLARLSALEQALVDTNPPVCKRAEGFAHYALYPESYLAAGACLPAGAFIFGVRSIGVGLAALAAAAAKSAPAVSVRPVGHPFAREVRIGASLAAELAAHDGPFAIVDEGPGLSGSSFAAVETAIERHGSAGRRICFLPSHGGDPGPKAPPARRDRWRAAERLVAAFEPAVLHSPYPGTRLIDWVGDIAGGASEPPVDVSAGRWRDHAQITPRPPCFAQQERRKFLVCGGNGPLLLKFIGLGRYGRRKRELARALSEASFTPRLRGERYGFLAVEWRADAAPWRPSREALIVHLAGYLGFRAKHFAGGEGASLARLASMARENATLALGEEAGRMLERRCELEQLAREAAPMAVDGRLHNWEWIADCSGAPLKTDAVDHHAGHDLVGCQDIAWDVAGAEAEFGLSPAESDELCGRLNRMLPRPLSRALLGFLRPCYLAFQLGLWRTAADAALAPADKSAALATAERYDVMLRQRLEAY